MSITTVSGCAACGTMLQVFLDLGHSPLAGDFPTMPASKESDRYPLRLGICPLCTLVQLVDIVDGSVLYGRDYPYYSGASQPVVDHFERYAGSVMSGYPLLLRRGVVEIACNDGTMLRHFHAAGYTALGIDPAEGPAKRAAERGLDVIVEPFSFDLADRIVSERGRQGVVIGNNVLAHVADLNDFLRGVRHLLMPEGVAIFEVQYLPDLLAGNMFDLIYHEHRAFYSVTSLKRLLQVNGLTLFTVEQIGMQGGSIRVVAYRDDRHGIWADHTVGHICRQEAPIVEMVKGMQGCAERIRERLVHLLMDQYLRRRTVAGFGASAKATTLLAFCGIDVDRLSYVVDTTAVKWGRYMPGTSIPIVSPAQQVERFGGDPHSYLLLVPNYLSPMLRQQIPFLMSGGQIIVPTPVPVVI